MGASMLYAYFLWLVGGLGGLHHAYLGQSNHAFIYSTTMGLCGFGWLVDFFCLPWYVRLARGEKKESNLGFSWRRWLLQFSMAIYFGWVGVALVPMDLAEDQDAFMQHKFAQLPSALLKMVKLDPAGLPRLVMFCLGVVLGATLAGNAGQRRVSRLAALKGVLVGVAVAMIFGKAKGGLALPVSPDPTKRLQLTWSHAFVGFMGATFSARTLRPASEEENARRFGSSSLFRYGELYTLTAVFLTLLLYATYENGFWPGERNSPGSKPTRVKVIVQEKLSTIDIEEIKENAAWVYAMYNAQGGFWGIMSILFEKLDDAVMGESRALEILGLDSDASMRDIKRAFRRASLTVHPDKLRGKSDEEKAAAEKEFIKLKEAYELLTNTPSSGKAPATEE